MMKQLPIIVLLGAICLIVISGCDDSSTSVSNHEDASDLARGTEFSFDPHPGNPKQTQRNPELPEPKPLRYTDIAEVAGLDFIYQNGAYGQELMVESLGGGCGWLDYDRDGWPDLFLTQGGKPDTTDVSTRPPDQIFRNRNGVRFERAAAAGVGGIGYGQGVAVGDFDNDGFDDLYVTNVGKNILYLNLGDGTFLDVTESANVGDDRWSSSAAWTDLNGDGLLDLYVCNYADYDPYSPLDCLKNGVPALCHPRGVPPAADECFLNLGDGRFEASSKRLGLFGEGNRGLGVVAADLNNDGLTDLYVCNDTTANFLFLAQADGTFVESALLCGAALNAQGYAQASMGVAVGDYDGNNALDLYLTHFTFEENALYQNLGGQGGFREVAGVTGMRALSYTKLGFGTVMYDLNCDGLMDLFVANGHIDPRNADGEGYEQFPLLMSYPGNHWIDRSNDGGPYFQRKAVGRGVAAADFDRDGDLDLAVVNQNSPMALLRNDSEHNSSIAFRFRGRNSARNGINVRVWMESGEHRSMQELVGGSSYCATHFPELVFPTFGSETCSVRVRWPTGIEHEYNNLAMNRPLIFFEEGGFQPQARPQPD